MQCETIWVNLYSIIPKPIDSVDSLTGHGKKVSHMTSQKIKTHPAAAVLVQSDNCYSVSLHYIKLLCRPGQRTCLHEQYVSDCVLLILRGGGEDAPAQKPVFDPLSLERLPSSSSSRCFDDVIRSLMMSQIIMLPWQQSHLHFHLQDECPGSGHRMFTPISMMNFNK